MTKIIFLCDHPMSDNGLLKLELILYLTLKTQSGSEDFIGCPWLGFFSLLIYLIYDFGRGLGSLALILSLIGSLACADIVGFPT